MKFYPFIFLCLFITLSCKKKESDPTPMQPGKIIYTTTFDEGTWTTHTSSKYTSAYDKESFNLSIDTMNWFGYELAPSVFLTTSYSIEADVKITLHDVNQLGYAGFIYNYVNFENYSIMNICTKGSFFAYKITNGVGEQLVYNTFSRALIKGSGQNNTIKIKQRQHSQEFIFNGISQGILSFERDNRLVAVGVTAVTYPDFYTPTKATFDNFTVKQIYQ